MRAWGNPILGVFDSWGNVNTPLSVMRRIAANRSSEVIVTFGPNWFSRRKELNEDIVDDVFGGREYWREVAAAEQDGEELWRAWLVCYRQALERVGFGYQLRFEVVPKTGQPLYLVFGTKHPKGVEVMKDAMWEVDRSDGMRFRDPRVRKATAVGQTSLFDDGNLVDPELVALACQCLEQGPMPVKDLEDWLLLKTSQWRARDAMRAVSALEEEGRLNRPPGRLTRNTVIRLR